MKDDMIEIGRDLVNEIKRDSKRDSSALKWIVGGVIVSILAISPVMWGLITTLASNMESMDKSMKVMQQDISTMSSDMAGMNKNVGIMTRDVNSMSANVYWMSQDTRSMKKSTRRMNPFGW